MLFNSYLYTIIFLPLTLAGWFFLNKLNMKAANVFMIIMSLWFYGGLNRYFPVIMAVSGIIGYTVSILANKRPGSKLLMAIGVAAELMILCVFKYLPGTPAEALFPGGSIILPVGISFYIFSLISFIIDRCRGEIGHDGLLNYILYVTWFPKLLEGPITGYEEIMCQFRNPENRIFNGENFTRGLTLFIFGMSKKLLIADNLAPVAVYAYQNVYISDTLMVLVGTAAYAFQLYFDFSGYCDMAAGTAQMFNITLPVNFDSPFMTVSFARFWQKWHMTLSRFFTKYVYIPLGGSRKGTLQTCINVLIVFVLSGIWHGAGMTYILWGVLTGTLVIITNLFFKKKLDGELHRAAVLPLRLLNFLVFCITLIFFGAPNMTYAIRMFKALCYPTWPGIFGRAAALISMKELYPLEKAVAIAVPSLSGMLKNAELCALLGIASVLAFGLPNAAKVSKEMKLTRKSGILMGILAIWCFVSMSGVSTFLYFQF